MIPGHKIGPESHAGPSNVIPARKNGAESHAGTSNVIPDQKNGAESHAETSNLIPIQKKALNHTQGLHRQILINRSTFFLLDS